MNSLKPKYFNCQVAAKCKIYVKDYKYKIYKIPNLYNLLNIQKIDSMILIYIKKGFINLYLKSIL